MYPPSLAFALSRIRRGKSHRFVCWCQRGEAVREFRHWAINSYEEDLPKGWLGKVIDLTAIEDSSYPDTYPDKDGTDGGGGVKCCFTIPYKLDLCD